ncbi:tape measure protein [Microbacterium phage Magritte]|nr:tape measure protein [Microbacterium phage Magritte]
MVDQRTRVIYQALADFSALAREVRQAQREIAQLKATEAAYNTASTRANRARTQALQARSRATTEEGRALRTNAGLIGRYTTAQTKLTGATKLGTAAINSQNRALQTNAQRLLAAAAAARAYSSSQQAIARNTGTANGNVRDSSTYQRRGASRNVRFTPSVDAAHEIPKRFSGATKAATEDTNRWGRAVMWLRGQLQSLNPVMAQSVAGATRLQRAFVRLGNFRPRLVPPFIALVPIIGSVIAALNPLIALMGAVGTVGLGLASNIGSLAGAFAALPGILSAVVGGIASVIASMGGVGNVFKTYSAMKKAAGKAAGGGAGAAGETQAERADRLARAEYGLSKAQRAVTKAQQNLNKAREQALEDLIDLRTEVSRASLNEERAIANLMQARDAYNNVMADPSSQAGDKADAAVAIKEAEADLADVRKQNTQNQKDLIEAEKRGIENSERVIDAKEDLQDAIYSEKDAQKALKDEYKGGSAAASALATATDEYNEALAKLSPSARSVVLALIGMQDQWNAMRGDLQENFFSQFAGDMDKVPRIIQNIGNFLRPASRAMGQFVSSLIDLLSSPEWTRDLAQIGEQNGRVLEKMGDILISLAGFFKDVIIAAEPFTDWMMNSLAEGADNMDRLLDTEEARGSFREWLSTVSDRLSKWWQIIKNIGATLFNYGSAASGFGDWLSDGFLKTTENWRAASEAAMQEGSPFRQFLEDIEPLLSNVNGLLGDFFGWLRGEIMDPDNIDDANDLVTLLRDDLGPALGDFLDALAKTDIDEKIIEAFSSIIRSITEIIDAGGSEAFESFWDVVTDFFDTIADFLSGLDPGQLDAIMKFIGTVVALSFIGKFTGITGFIGGLLSLAGSSGLLTKIFDGLGKMDKMGFAGLGKLVPFLSILTTLLGIADVGGKVGSIFDALGKGDLKGAQEGITDVDNGLMFTPNPLAPVPGTPGYNPLPVISDTLGGIDSMFGTNLKSQLQTFVNDFLKEIDNFFIDVQTNWDNFWGGIETNWNTFWENMGDPKFWEGLGEGLGDFILGIQEGWDQFWGTDLPASVEETSKDFEDSWNGFWGGIETEWNNFWDDLSTGKMWENINTELANFSRDFQIGWDGFWAGIGTGFQAVVNGIQSTWAGIQNAFASPVNWVIQNVWNGGIVPFWNGLAGKLGWQQLDAAPGIGDAGGRQQGPTFKRAEGGVLPGYTPGRDVHDFQSPTGGRLLLSGGEAVMRPEWTRAMGGPKAIDAMNKDARRGRFATGGVIGRRKNPTMGRRQNDPITRNSDDFGGDLWGMFPGLFANPAQYISNGIGSLIAPAMAALTGGSEFGRMLSQIPTRAIQSLVGIASEKAKAAKDAQGSVMADQSGMKWPSMWAIVKKAFPGASLNSAYRPGARTVNGGMSYHSQGRAIDTTPSMAIFNWLKENYPNSRELIFSPAGNRQLQNGREHFWGGAVRAQHWDHVHWAMKNGGVFPGGAKRKGTHDNGGWIPHGRTATNLSGRPEAVLTSDESKGLKALMNGVGLSRNTSPVGLGNSVGSLRGASQQVIDNSITIEKLEVNNPVPEKTSDSLPKAIRRVGYTQNARQNA